MRLYDGLAACKSKVQMTEVETIEYRDSNQEEDNTRLEIHLQSHLCLIIKCDDRFVYPNLCSNTDTLFIKHLYCAKKNWFKWITLYNYCH